MNETEKKRDTLVILGLLALIVALFLSIRLIFFFLGKAIPQGEPEADRSGGISSAVQAGELPAPGFCPHCGQGLPASFQWGMFCPWCGEKAEEG